MRKSSDASISRTGHRLLADGLALGVQGLGLILAVWALAYLLVLPLVDAASWNSR